MPLYEYFCSVCNGTVTERVVLNRDLADQQRCPEGHLLSRLPSKVQTPHQKMTQWDKLNDDRAFSDQQKYWDGEQRKAHAKLAEVVRESEAVRAGA